MSIAFSGSELVNIAIGIEKRGIAFYDAITKSTKNATARDVFQNLANMEREHVQIFQNMLTEAEKYQIPEAYAEEYAAYLQALIDNAIFTDDFITSEMATKANSDIEALELAISAEKDSILFYYGMKEITPQRAQLTVNKVLAEEKLHLRQLSKLKKELADL
jgi:rubrerythrin